VQHASYVAPDDHVDRRALSAPQQNVAYRISLRSRSGPPARWSMPRLWDDPWPARCPTTGLASLIKEGGEGSSRSAQSPFHPSARNHTSPPVLLARRPRASGAAEKLSDARRSGRRVSRTADALSLRFACQSSYTHRLQIPDANSQLVRCISYPALYGACCH
jgi:hypothetical protein